MPRDHARIRIDIWADEDFTDVFARATRPTGDPR